METIELAELVEREAFHWSDAFMAQMALLSAKQRRAIILVSLAELHGIPLNRMLRTKESCLFCGYRPHTWQNKEGVQAAVEQHALSCEQRASGERWAFVAWRATYYRWQKDQLFRACQERARQELYSVIMAQPAFILGVSTLLAAQELRRQVREGERPIDRFRAAIAILDRAGFAPGQQQREEPQMRRIQSLLEELRGTGRKRGE